MARIYLALASVVLFLSFQEASAQVCRPVAERTGEVGCWIIAHQPIGQLTKPETFWHLDVYATKTEAEAAKTAGGAAVESLGKIFRRAAIYADRILKGAKVSELPVQAPLVILRRPIAGG